MTTAQAKHTNSRRGTRLRSLAAATAALTVVVGAAAFPASAKVKDKDGGSVQEAVSAKQASADPTYGAMHLVVDQIGADELWAKGITGDGINVAVIDTGVSPVEALADQVVATVDLSSDASDPTLRFLDAYGHGTHMAGIIAGMTPGADPALAAQHPEWFLGVAPDAGIVSVKVGGYDGAVDVTQVIAGVDWVVAHADELGIRVINLSYSSGSTLGYETDPLAAAVERAWNAGIVVVVAAGNDGRQAQELAAPAHDPFVISVAAAEATWFSKSFQVPSWASSGDGDRNPDVTAPGASIESLRVPDSYIDQEYPEGYVDEQTFKGSGSSQAAAIVSGAAALILEAHPDYNPDQVKALLQADTAKVRPGSEKYSGAGLIQLAGVIDAEIDADEAAQNFPPSDGSGSLDDARGDALISVDGEPLVGDVTVLGTPWISDWDGVRWSGGEWDGVRWSAGDWMGVRWSDATWTGEAWTGVRWSDEIWSGVRWSDAAWDGVRWSGVRWSDVSWDGVRWSGVRWSEVTWDGVRWSGVRWTDDSWDGVRWSGVRWSGVRWSGAGWN